MPTSGNRWTLWRSKCHSGWICSTVKVFFYNFLSRVIAFTRLLYTVLFFFLLLLFLLLFKSFRILLLKLIFGAWMPVWVHGRAFWWPGMCLSTGTGILVPGRLFGHTGGHFGAQARVSVHGWLPVWALSKNTSWSLMFKFRDLLYKSYL